MTGAPDPVAVAERGLAVFPLPPGGRRPAVAGWQRRCVADPVALRRLWRPGDNVGVGCRASNLVGLDLDHGPDVDGAAAFAAVCAAHRQDWPDTLTVRTPSGGVHLYFRAPAGRTVHSASAVLGPGIDVRGPGQRLGGYLVGPGSVVDGVPYVVEHDTAIRPLPSWLADLLAQKLPTKSATPTVGTTAGKRAP